MAVDICAYAPIIISMSYEYSQLQDCACAMLRQSSRIITHYFEEAFREVGLTSSQFNVLSVLANTGPLPISQLAQRMLQDRTGLTRNLSIMEKKQWVRYEPCEDQRIKKAALTKAGYKKLDKAIPLWEAVQATVSKQLSGLEGLKSNLHALKKLSEP